MKADRIRNGLDHWRKKARERAGDTGVTQLEAMVTILQSCEHGPPEQTADANYTVCFLCKWLLYVPTNTWEPVGFGR